MPPGTTFWTEYKDLLALLVSFLALVISSLTTWWTLQTTRKLAKQNLDTTQKIAEDAAAHNIRLAQNATYQRIHELLVDPEAARGRRLLFRAHSAKNFPAIGDAAWDEINYSLALYDTLGGYVNRDQVNPEVVLDAWHHPLANIADPVRGFMAHRRAQGIHQPWAHLVDLLRKAEEYDCRCPGEGVSS
jgi:hypothetical protein